MKVGRGDKQLNKLNEILIYYDLIFTCPAFFNLI